MPMNTTIESKEKCNHPQSRHRQYRYMLLSMTLATSLAHAEDPVELPKVVVSGDKTSHEPARLYFSPINSTATKTATSNLTIAQSISTITRSQLDDQNPQTVKDALNYTAGVLSVSDATQRYDSVFLRGFGGFGTATRIADFWDGLKLPRGQAFALPAIDPYLLDHIDVLKGPSAVLYGQTSPGGLINQSSRAPSHETRHQVFITGGQHDRLDSGFNTQGAIDEAEQWQYNITGVSRRANTRYANVDEERNAANISLRWTPDHNTFLQLNGFYQKDPKGGYFNSIYPQSMASPQYRGVLDEDLNVGDPSFDHYQRQQYALGYQFEHHVNHQISISSKARYSDIDLDFKNLQMAAAVTDEGLLPRQAAHSIESVDGFVTDNRIQIDFNTDAIQHRLITGIDFQHSNSYWDYRFGPAPALDLNNPQYGIKAPSLSTIIDNRQTLQQTGLYIQDQATLDHLHATFGIRRDWTQQRTHHALTSTKQKQSSTATTYRAGLLYQFDNGLAPYTSYATSFEPTVGADITGSSFKPSKATQWEAGVKFSPDEIPAIITLSAFHIRQKNVLTPDTTPGFNVQQGEVRSQGIELEARGQLNEQLSIIAAFTALDTEVTESTVKSNIGKRPQAVPDHYGSTWLNYRINQGVLSGLTVGSGLRFVGSRFSDDDNTIKTDHYTLIDLAVRYNLAQLMPSLAGAEWTLNVNNLFDKTYYASCSSNFYCQYGEPAKVTTGLKYTW